MDDRIVIGPLFTHAGFQSCVFGIMNAVDYGKIADALAAKYGAMLTRA